MPVPKRKRSRARRDKRFANKGLAVKALARCQNCQEVLEPHQACQQCGHYKGIKIFETKLERAVKRGETRKTKKERSGKSSVEEAPEQEK